MSALQNSKILILLLVGIVVSYIYIYSQSELNSLSNK